MNERARMMRALDSSIIECDGELPAELRRRAHARAGELARRGPESEKPSGGDPLTALVDKVALDSYKVLDDDVEALEEAGYGEDAIFEAIVAAAVGAGSARLEIGLNALRSGS